LGELILINNSSIRTTDLFSIAPSGVNASNQLLTTAGNNIANVNTEGFVRERTNFVSQLSGGVGQSTTERVLNIFAQNQLRRDTTMQSEHEIFYAKTSVLDNMFASESNSISSSMSRFFAAVQTASDDPTSMASRESVLIEAQSMIGQIGTVTGFLRQKEEEFNLELDINIDTINGLVRSIADLNQAIVVTKANLKNDEPGALLNQRDQAILELASLVSIETRESSNNSGAVMVNLSAGESLVLQDGSFKVFNVSNDADINAKSLELKSNGKPTTLSISETDLGGAIGGLFRFRDEVLQTSLRELGQIALAITETMNTQNRQGMDYDQQLGSNIFTLPDFIGLNYPDNNNTNSIVTGRIAEGAAADISSADYSVTIDNVTAGAPPTLDITVSAINADGSAVRDTDGVAISQTYTGIEAADGTFSSVIGGLELEFSSGSNYSTGDQFLIQPTKNTADVIELSITRPEDLALAGPIRINAGANNLGDAILTSTSVSNTIVDNTLNDSKLSAFDGNGDIHGPGNAPGGTVGAPAQILFTASDEYHVLDSAGTVITVVSATSDLTNLLAQAQSNGTGPVWPTDFSALDDYPGYDFSLQGIPKAGDSFNIGFNTDGLNDNRNGLLMSDLQNLTNLQTDNSGSGETVSFHEAYGNIVTDVGQKTASADIALQAAVSLKSSSEDWFLSVSGVSLDEEAANLIRYQQSYQAAARLLSTAQDLFNTILSVVS
jgi:flagellar hook-associated protein 1 FlgK